jgi:protein O-mannosyl-transferase
LGRHGRPTPSQTAVKTKPRETRPTSDWGRVTVPSGPEVISFKQLAGFAGIFLATWLAYLPGLHGGLVWDDAAHVTPRDLRSFHGLWRIWFELGATQQYYPLLHSAFWMEHRLWGGALLGYHLVNVFQHAICACLLVLIVRYLKLPGAWLAGFIFALHPVCVEAVAWISEQKDTLSGVFYLASALVYLHFDRDRKRSQYFWALVLFVLALLCKTVTATLPAALLVVFWWQRGGLDWRRDVRPLLPWFVIGAGSGLFTAWVEATFIGAKGAGYDLTLAQHFLLIGRVLCFYAAKVVWPFNLLFSYPHWQLDPTVWWQYLYPFAVIVVLAGLIALARRKDAAVQRGPLAGFLFFAGTLFPVLGFLHVFPFKYSYVADHFQYLAMLGIIVPVAWLIAQISLHIPKVASAAIAFFVVAILGVSTWRQAALYHDPETLYRATLAGNPKSWMTHNNLGIYLAEKPGRLDDAIAEFEATIRIRPDHMKAHMNLGNALMDKPGRLADSIAEYHIALQLDPNYAPAHDNLGVALMQMPGSLPEAITEFETAVRLRPNDARTHEMLGIGLSQTPDKLPEAIAEFQEALRIEPGNADLYIDLGDALAKIPERRQEAIAQYEAALRSGTDAETRQELMKRLQDLRAEPDTEKR